MTGFEELSLSCEGKQSNWSVSVCVCVSVLLKAQIESFVCLSLPLVLTSALVLVRTLVFLSNNSSRCVSGTHSRIGLCVWTWKLKKNPCSAHVR